MTFYATRLAGHGGRGTVTFQETGFASNDDDIVAASIAILSTPSNVIGSGQPLIIQSLVKREFHFCLPLFLSAFFRPRARVLVLADVRSIW